MARTRTEFTYSDYKDWNNPLNPADALYAGKMTEKKNGTVVRDITTTLTETGQMYVVMPVPASVKAAIKPTNQPPNWTLTPNTPAPATQTAAVVTPRLANGKPDLTGVWGGGYNPITGGGTRRCGPTQVNCKIRNGQLLGGLRVDLALAVWHPGSSRLQTRVLGQGSGTRSVDEQGRSDHDVPADGDSAGRARPAGSSKRKKTSPCCIRRAITVAETGNFATIPTDGRKHDPQKAIVATYYGNTVGSWEGDTLVLDSISFVDTTWFGRGGLFHSSNMHIVEKLTRNGDEIRYEMTIEDPEVLVEPWVMPPRTLRPPGWRPGILAERAYCEVYEESNITTQLRHKNTKVGGGSK